MTLHLNLSPDLVHRLTQAASAQGVSADELTLRLLDAHLPPTNRQLELVQLLQIWIDDPDAKEQKETGDYLIRALDEDRNSARKLFPRTLEGKTW